MLVGWRRWRRLAAPEVDVAEVAIRLSATAATSNPITKGEIMGKKAKRRSVAKPTTVDMPGRRMPDATEVARLAELATTLVAHLKKHWPIDGALPPEGEPLRTTAGKFFLLAWRPLAVALEPFRRNGAHVAAYTEAEATVVDNLDRLANALDAVQADLHMRPDGKAWWIDCGASISGRHVEAMSLAAGKLRSAANAKAKPTKKPRKRPAEEYHKRWRQMYREGMTQGQIAQAEHVEPKAVQVALRRLKERGE